MIRDKSVYVLMAQDEEICTIDRGSGRVAVFREDLLPFDIYLEAGDDADLLNNLVVFDWWCAHRILSLDREYAKELLNSCGLKQATTDRDRADIALRYKCLSLKDFYWVRKEYESVGWDSVNLFDNSLSNAVMDIALLGRNMTVTNLSLVSSDLATDGLFPKAWVRTENGFVLYKADRNDSVNKEVIASRVLQELGFPVLEYAFGEYKGVNVSVCNCFTSKDLGYVTAGDMGANYDLELPDEYYFMNLADYLVGNSDRHQDNWGYLFDSNRKIVGLAPIFDFNHAFEAPFDFRCMPEQYLGRNISALTAAKEAVERLNLELEQLLGNDFYTQFVNERIRLLYCDNQIEQLNKSNVF